MSSAVVLVSGGLDSATVLAMARAAGHELLALSFRYGQRHAIELDAAARVCRALGVHRHQVVDIDLAHFGGSALTDSHLAVPKHAAPSEIGPGIPITYVPARNTIFLAFALAYAEVHGAADIYLGVNALDYSGYPDCRPEYLAAFERMANLALKAAVDGTLRIEIHAPLLHWTKGEIIRQGLALGVDYGLTTSCYDPDAEGRACGHCDSCLLRRKGFAENDLPDPARYR